ncbi:DUF3298 domain-containing protein [Solibacillus sp. A46]|uniref:DUF3298 domain-containing protein n=2 Tax=Caryophanaceae TaxID=186818 RepID=A0ABR8Y112_9BACL|nr:DUF3298 domain-containing protein [Solibacillus faecavium]
MVYYPYVFFTENNFWENKMNEAIKEQVKKLISDQVGDMPTTVEEMRGFYEIKNNQRQILSLSLSNYTYHQKAAHGMTYIKSLNFDLEKQKICKLEDLFIPGSDYIKRISSLVNIQIHERDIPLLDDFNGIQPNQDFYIADKTLVIYFQLYEITPYYVGLPMFPISVFDLTDIIDESSPLSRMAVNN